MEQGKRNIFVQFNTELLVGHIEEGENAVPAGAMKLSGGIQVNQVEYDHSADKAWLLEHKILSAMSAFPPELIAKIKELADQALNSSGPSRIIKPGLSSNQAHAVSSILQKK